MGVLDNIGSELKTRNFSIYGQWTGILSIVLCLAVGIANIFHFDLIIIFSVICLLTGLSLIFLEIPFLLKICPMSENFTTFIRRFQSLWGRAAYYAVAAVVQWLSLIMYATSLIAAAVFLSLAAIFYALAAVKGQSFMSSKTLGGGGLASAAAQQIV